MVGETISHYRITGKLGEGGMGVVYLARDTKLDRDVALKFLPPHLAASEHDKARFMQEARAAAALNHPNVCSIIDIREQEIPGSGGPQLFIVMEYVDGQTLGEKQTSMTVAKAVDIGIQVAEGLAAAHEKGIVHRDIKPENIMVRKDGIVQIMDFGLAKLRSGGSKVTRLTREGSTVGTAGYMSPEQVQGQDADHRADIFSLGVLLYEMIAGEPPFKGVHETALIYEIVNVDPAPLTTIRHDLDPELDRIVLECLQKEPDERYNSARDVVKDLKRVKRESSRQRHSRVSAARPAARVSRAGSASGGQGGGAEADPDAARSPRARELAAWCAAVLLLGATAYLLLRPPAGEAPARPMVRSSVVVPDSIYVHSFGAALGPPVLSSDGSHLAFTGITPDGRWRVYVRAMDSDVVRALPGTGYGVEPFWSPDGKYVGYFDGIRMKKVDLAGGSPTTITVVPNARGGAWNADGDIVFSPDYQTGLFRVPADGSSEAVQITFPDSARKEGSHRWPVFLPDGKRFLYLARAASETGEAEGDAVFVGSLDGSVRKMLVQSSYNAAYADGRLLFARNGVLLAQKFDPVSLLLEGDPEVIQEGLLTDISYNMAVYTVSRTGMLLFQTGTAEAGARPMFLDRTGKVVRLLDDRSEQDQARFSPDGRQVALYVYDTRTRRSNIWAYDLRTGGRRRVTTRLDGDFFPVWSPDGSRIYFSSGGVVSTDLYVQSVSRGGGEEFFGNFGTRERFLDVSPDGTTLLTLTISPGTTRGDIWMVRTDGGDRNPVPFQQTKFNEYEARISPDGKWVAFVSDESGTDEIYLKQLTAPASDPWKVSTGGGVSPRWGRDSGELLYLNLKREVVSVPLAIRGTSIEAGSVKPLFLLPPLTLSYDVSPDGETFFVTRSLEMQKFPPLTLVADWTSGR